MGKLSKHRTLHEDDGPGSASRSEIQNRWAHGGDGLHLFFATDRLAQAQKLEETRHRALQNEILSGKSLISTSVGP